MKKYFLIFIVLFLPYTQLLAEPIAPQLPMPEKLSADWWSYFQPAEPIDNETLTKRTSEIKTALLALKQKISSDDANIYHETITNLLAELQRYVSLKGAGKAVDLPAALPLDTYSYEQIIQRYTLNKQQKQTLRTLTDEINWQTNYVAEEKKRQSRRRTEYLSMPVADPQRLLSGLKLMLSRIRLESETLEFDRRTQEQRALQTRVTTLDSELDQVANKLIATPEEIIHWQAEQKSLEQQLGKLSEDSSPQLGMTPSELDSQSRANTDAAIIHRMLKEVHRSVLEQRLFHTQLTITLLKTITHPAQIDKKLIKQLIQNSKDRIQQINQQISYWKRVSDRVRTQSTQNLMDTSIAPQIQMQERTVLQTAENTEQKINELKYVIELNQFFSELLQHKMSAGESTLIRSMKNVINFMSMIWTNGLDLLSATLFELNETPVTTLGLLRVLLILTISWWVSKIVRRAIQHLGERRKTFSDSALYTLGRMVHYVVITLGIVIGLSSIGIDLTKFALFASALGVGVGFGLQTLVSNFVAGLIILFEKSLKVGDFVELQSGVVGEVREINMRSTLLTTNDNIDILVPNSEFVNGQVINWTHREAYRRMRVPFGVAYGTDKELVKKAVLEAADTVPWTLKNVKGRGPQVWFVQFGDSSLNFELIIWLTKDAVKRPAAVQAAYLWEIETKLREYDIEVPFPQRDLHLRSVFGQKDEQGMAFILQNTRGK